MSRALGSKSRPASTVAALRHLGWRQLVHAADRRYVAAVLTSLLAAPAPAGAITNGVPDGEPVSEVAGFKIAGLSDPLEWRPGPAVAGLLTVTEYLQAPSLQMARAGDGLGGLGRSDRATGRGSAEEGPGQRPRRVRRPPHQRRPRPSDGFNPPQFSFRLEGRGTQFFVKTVASGALAQHDGTTARGAMPLFIQASKSRSWQHLASSMGLEVCELFHRPRMNATAMCR